MDKVFKVVGAVLLVGLLAAITRPFLPHWDTPYEVAYSVDLATLLAEIAVAWAVFFYRPFKTRNSK